MKNHVSVYLSHFDYAAESFDDLYIPCEVCKNPAVDINHIEPRGMGGSKKKDGIENLVAMCRLCHIEFEQKRISKDTLRYKHFNLLRAHANR